MFDISMFNYTALAVAPEGVDAVVVTPWITGGLDRSLFDQLYFDGSHDFAQRTRTRRKVGAGKFPIKSYPLS